MLNLSMARFLHLLVFLLLIVRIPVAVADFRVAERMLAEPVFGGTMLVREAGQEQERMLLLVHGLGAEAGTTWDSVMAELARDYHVVVPDLPGFGRSAKGNQLYSPDNYAALLDWLVTSLPAKPLSLVGHSMGGGVAMIYAARYAGHLERLVLVDSVGLLHRLAVSQDFVGRQIKLDVPLVSSVLESSLGKIAGLVLEKTSRVPLDPGVVLDHPALRSRLLAGEPSRIAALALVQTDYSLLLSLIKTPTWLIWGEEDQVASLRIAKVLQWILPRVELKVLPKLGHSPMLEAGEVFCRTLRRALVETPRTLPRPLHREGSPDGVCENQSGGLFQGSYRTLRITGCKNIRLVNVSARKLQITDSEVEIEATQIQTDGSDPAISLVRSNLTATGMDIHAETGIMTDQSRLDLAGVRFVGARTAIRAQGNPSALLSSASFKEFSGIKTAVHLSRALQAGDAL